MGRQVIPVVEKYTELDADPQVRRKGRRAAADRHARSSWPRGAAAAGNRRGGYRSKFGLTVSEILRAVEELKSRGMHDCFKLLHFHLGSQITNIRHVKTAVTEAARAYADLCKRGAGLELSRYRRRIGRRLRRLANQLRIERQLLAQRICHRRGAITCKSVCEEAGVPHPTIICESGRAVAAYHACSVFGTLGVAGQGNGDENLLDIPGRFRAAAVRSCRYVSRASPPATCWKACTTPSRRWTWR